SIRYVGDLRQRNPFYAAADQFNDGISKLMCNQPSAFFSVRAAIPFTNSFTIVGSLQVPQPGFDRNSAVTHTRISESDELGIDGRRCPVLRLDGGWIAEFAKRIKAAADQSNDARVIKIVP